MQFVATQERGSKQYELTDHLGNIRTVVGDIKEPQLSGLFRAPTQTLNNYYPYGMLQSGRSKSSEGYRFGYQGQEADNKIGGLGQHLNYTFRNYDSWGIRFGAIDPLAAKYPHNSPYAFSENRVIDGVELEGLEWLYAMSGKFLGQGKDRSNPLVYLITYEEIDCNIVRHETPLTYKGKAIGHHQFQQYGAVIYNETYYGDDAKGMNYDQKLLIADALFNKGKNIPIEYPAYKKKEITLQFVLDKIMYTNDSHEQRMSERRINPPDDALIPGTNLKLSRIRTKNYAKFYRKTDEERNNSREMIATNKAIIDALRRDLDAHPELLREEDTAGGKSSWSGNSTTNAVK